MLLLDGSSFVKACMLYHNVSTKVPSDVLRIIRIHNVQEKMLADGNWRQSQHSPVESVLQRSAVIEELVRQLALLHHLKRAGDGPLHSFPSVSLPVKQKAIHIQQLGSALLFKLVPQLQGLGLQIAEVFIAAASTPMLQESQLEFLCQKTAQRVSQTIAAVQQVCTRVIQPQVLKFGLSILTQVLAANRRPEPTLMASEYPQKHNTNSTCIFHNSKVTGHLVKHGHLHVTMITENF